MDASSNLALPLDDVWPALPGVMPDYQGHGIVNLMQSIAQACGAVPADPRYPPCATAVDIDTLARHRTVLLLVIDGLGYDLLCRRAAGGEIHSRLSARLSSVFPSTTVAAITSFMTGRAPQQHGLTGWFMYFRELGGVFAVLPGVLRGGRVAGGRNAHDSGIVFDGVPISDRLQRRSVVICPRRIAGSNYNRTHCGRAEVRAYDTLDEFFLTLAQVAREACDGPQFVYAYWPDIDTVGHECGVDSRETDTLLAQIDERFGRLCRRLDGSGTFVLLTADHGMIDTDEAHTIDLCRHPALARLLELPLCGERRVPYCYVRSGCAEAFEACVREELGHRALPVPSRELIANGYFGCGDAHPALSDRIGDYVLLMRDNYVLCDWLPGECRYRQIGVHGGLSEAEMYVPLAAVSL